MTKSYSFEESNEVAILAAKEITLYLKSIKGTVAVINVEKDERFQKMDIDLVWKIKSKRGKIKTIPIEIKGDRYFHTNNYFFETISNESKASEGCILYTKSHYIFYYFIKEKELHRMPTKETIDWFKKNKASFFDRKVESKMNGKTIYSSKGKLVPRHVIQKFVPEIKVKNIREILEAY